MKKLNNLLFFVIHPKVIDYLDDFFGCIINQTISNFDILVIEDQIERIRYPSKLKKLKILKAGDNQTPSEIRSMGLKFAVEEGYKNLIFSDADDFFTKNRLENSVYLLTKYDFIFNEQSSVDVLGRILRKNLLKEFNAPRTLNSLEEILNRNFVGLTNSAVKIFPDIVNFEIKKNKAFDWFFFSKLLLENKKGFFDSSSVSFYRQTDSNIVGIPSEISYESLDQNLDIKLKHYEDLLIFMKDNSLRKDENILKSLYDDFSTLKEKFKSAGFKKDYLGKVNRNFHLIYKGWWSEIITERMLKEYE